MARQKQERGGEEGHTGVVFVDAKAYEYLCIAEQALAAAERALCKPRKKKTVKAAMKVFMSGRGNIQVAIVFAAFAAEALINHYAFRKSSGAYLNNYLDKLNTVQKWVVVPRLFTGKAINAGAEPIGGLKKLMRLRNQLAHPKTRERESLDEAIRADHELQDARDAIETVKKLAAILDSIDPDVSVWL